MNTLPKCESCGQFCQPAAWKMVYTGVIPMPDHEIYRCRKCFDTYGPFSPDSRIRPEASCGLVSPQPPTSGGDR